MSSVPDFDTAPIIIIFGDVLQDTKEYYFCEIL